MSIFYFIERIYKIAKVYLSVTFGAVILLILITGLYYFPLITTLTILLAIGAISLLNKILDYSILLMIQASFLKLLIKDYAEAIIGDLHERFKRDSVKFGRLYAEILYLKETAWLLYFLLVVFIKMTVHRIFYFENIEINKTNIGEKIAERFKST